VNLCAVCGSGACVAMVHSPSGKLPYQIGIEMVTACIYTHITIGHDVYLSIAELSGGGRLEGED
jgi:hypothetical protein